LISILINFMFYDQNGISKIYYICIYAAYEEAFLRIILKYLFLIFQ
jgi:hypothetical protein